MKASRREPAAFADAARRLSNRNLKPIPDGLRSTAVVIFGPPGAGKGTQTRKLSELFSVPRIATGEMIREEVRRRTEFGRRIEIGLAEGQFVDDETIFGMLDRRLRREDLQRGLLLDGFPRTAPQARQLESVATQFGIEIRAFELKASREVLIRRLSGRRVCEKCGAVFHQESEPPRRENVCDDCGSELSIRDDDSAEVINPRLDIHDEATVPAIRELTQVLKRQGRKVEPIDAEQDPESVTRNLLERLRNE